MSKRRRKREPQLCSMTIRPIQLMIRLKRKLMQVLPTLSLLTSKLKEESILALALMLLGSKREKWMNLKHSWDQVTTSSRVLLTLARVRLTLIRTRSSWHRLIDFQIWGRPRCLVQVTTAMKIWILGSKGLTTWSLLNEFNYSLYLMKLRLFSFYFFKRSLWQQWQFHSSKVVLINLLLQITEISLNLWEEFLCFLRIAHFGPPQLIYQIICFQLLWSLIQDFSPKHLLQRILKFSLRSYRWAFLHLNGLFSFRAFLSYLTKNKLNYSLELLISWVNRYELIKTYLIDLFRGDWPSLFKHFANQG